MCPEGNETTGQLSAHASLMGYAGLVGTFPLDPKKRVMQEEPRWGTIKGRSKEAQRWSTEALKAIDTHLSLLQKAYRGSIAAIWQNEEQGEGREAADSKRLRRMVDSQLPPVAIAEKEHGSGHNAGPCVELNSLVPLPDGWEQFLDLKTGQAYYIDWRSCRRSYIDPRTMHHEAHSKGGSIQQGHVYARTRWQLQAACVEPETSDCVSDGCNYVDKMETEDNSEVKSKLVTTPMLEEDWDLMKLRGWLSLSTDNHSEITSEVCSASMINQACPPPSVVTGDDIPLMGSDGLAPLPLFNS